MNSIHKKFKRSFDSLDEIFQFNRKFCQKNSLDSALVILIDFVTEEIFTNQVKFHPESHADIAIELSLTDKKLTICIRDFEVDLYDISRAADVDVHKPIQERKSGGLGLHLVKQMVDKIEYDYKNRTSTITLTKYLE